MTSGGRALELRQALAPVCDRRARLFDSVVVTFLQPELRALTFADETDDLLPLLPVVVPLLHFGLPVARNEQRPRLSVHPVRNRTAERVSQIGLCERPREEPHPKTERAQTRDKGLAILFPFF